MEQHHMKSCHGHEESCDCNHEESCGCNHEESCGCNHDEGCGCNNTPSPAEVQLLQSLAAVPCLPVVRFMLGSTKSAHLLAAALDPVYLTAADTPIEQVKAQGAHLLALEEKGLLAIDYNAKLAEPAYTIYRESAVYALFLETTEQASLQPAYLYDTGFMQEGAMAVTPMGHAILVISEAK